MPLYVSEHTDYADPNNPADVDAPVEPYIVLADNAVEAAKQFFRMDDSTYDEAVILLLDPILEKLRGLGWTITPPPLLAGEEKP